MDCRVRAEFPEKIAHGGVIFSGGQFFGFVSGHDPVSREFEPAVARPRERGQFAMQIGFPRHERVLPLLEFLRLHRAVEHGVGKTVELGEDSGDLVFRLLDDRRGRAAGLILPFVQLLEILLAPLVRYGKPADGFFDLVCKLFLPQKSVLPAGLGAALLGTTIINILAAARLRLALGGNRVAALAATGKTEELERLDIAIFAGLSVVPHGLLYLIVGLFGDHRLVAPFVQFAAIQEVAVVKGIGEELRYGREMKRPSAFGLDAE